MREAANHRCTVAFRARRPCGGQRDGARRTASVATVIVAALAACSGGGTANGVRVTGTVADIAAPVAGALVLLGGKQATTAADGTFSLDGIQVPYDVTVVNQTGRAAFMARGVHATSIYVVLAGGTGLYRFVDVSGAVGPTPAGTVTIVTATDVQVPAIFAPRLEAPVNNADGSFAFTGTNALQWPGPDTTQEFDLNAIQYTPDGNGWPVSYSGSSTTFTGIFTDDGVPYAGVSLPPISGSPATTTVTGTVTLDPSWPGPATVGGTSTIFPLSSVVGASAVAFSGATVTGPLSGTTFSALLPSFAGALGIWLSVGDPASSYGEVDANVTPGQTGVALMLPAAPSLTSPANGATGVGASTVFAFTAPRNSLRMLAVRCSDGVRAWIITVYDTLDSMTLPNLSAEGMTLPSSMPCTWFVSAMSETIDELLDTSFTPSSSWVVLSPGWSFTTR